MKGTARPRTRGRWVMVGVVVWLILGTSITLEQGQDAEAQWGSALTLAVIGILIPLAAGPTAVTPLRGIKRMVVRRAARWFR